MENRFQKLIDNFIYIEICLAIISLVSSFFTIYQTFTTQGFNILIGISTLLFAVLVSFFVIKRIKNLRNFQNNMMSKFSDCFHKLNHSLRDTFFDTKRLKETEELTINHLTEKFISNVKDCINYLSNALSNVTEKDVSVCIKVFEPTKTGNQHDENNIYISTLCRSSNTHSNRANKEKPSKVIDNTDFSTILFDGASEFYQINLIEFSNINEYRNSNKLWRKQYKCTIVVPIRIEQKFISGIDDGTYDIMGFVCVDSNSIDTFTSDNIEYYVNIVKSFSDALYKYFKQYKFYINELS